MAVHAAQRMKMKWGLAPFFLLVALTAWAQSYPDRPIRFYVGFPPGGSTDLVSRYLGDKLSQRLKQPVAVEQKTGATGLLANDAVAKAPPDGHTMVLLTGGHPGTAAVMKSLPYDPVKDFGMVSVVIEYPMTVSVAPNSPIQSFPDLLARAKAAPGRISFSSAGPGSLHHLLGEWMNIEAGTQMLHVPFKGAAPAFTELLGGRIDVLIETATFAFPMIKSGRLRPLALSSAGRYPLMPDVPTVGETLKGVAFSSWLGLAVAPGTPRSSVDRLNKELRAILALDETRERFAGFGGVPAPSSPEQMAARIDQEVARWKRVVQTRGIERQ
ncbi:MAG TPA: tripartite tricarboxylate transporter substrate binding protein [Burkholderiales bacterium]|nr:tripartite tricarboxylate transporter substrate binding protein [Burkholderiales bacterium]